jgi:hypothetical protein
MFNGTASSMENYVSVRWWWLSLPLGVLFLCLVFLVATVMKSSKEKEHVGVWKTSGLATLLYGPPDEMQRKITSSTSIETPKAKTKELMIKLMHEKGWRISGNRLSSMTPQSKQYQLPPGWI